MKATSILLPTKTSNIYIFGEQQWVYRSKMAIHKTSLNNPQHIYLIDKEAKLKEGDWYIVLVNELMEIHQRGKNDKSGIKFIEGNSWVKGCKKIITSTDSSLGLPLLSEESIKLLIDYYNKNSKMPESVEVEEEFIDMFNKIVHPTRVQDGCSKRIKLNSWGTVNISIPEEQNINKLMFDAIDYTIKKYNGEIERGYEVSFLYPANNIAFQKLIKARELYLSSIPKDRMYTRDEVITFTNKLRVFINENKPSIYETDNWIKEHLK